MHYLRKTALVIICIIISKLAFSQSGGVNYQQQYLNAKLFFQEGKYNLAQAAFKPILKKDSQNPFSAYASFYYALSAYHQGYLAMARDMLLQIKSVYPSWNNINEANFWLANIYFEQEEYGKALWGLESIKSKVFAEDIEKLKYAYLNQIQDISILKKLLKEYPHDKSIAEPLALRLSEQPIHLQDQELLLAIIKKFKLEKEKYKVADVPKSVFKSSYKVAVLLPFMVDGLEPVRGRKRNQFVLDLYEGIRMAVQDLYDAGTDIELLVYDTKRSKEETTKILYGNNMGHVDLIIGPLYPEPSKVALDYSRKNKINIVNPLSSNRAIIGNNPFSFLFAASNETVGIKAGEYAVAHFPKDKAGMIFYGGSKADSIKAYNYKQTVESNGMRISYIKKIEDDDTKEILKLLTTRYEFEGEDVDEYVFAKDSIGSIYVVSNKGGLASNASSAVEIRGDSIALLGDYRWLDYGFVNYDSYEVMGVSLIAPNYINVYSEAYSDIRDRYVRTFATLPSQNVLKGYETMRFFGNCLKKYGNYFQHDFKDEDMMPGYLSEGFSYDGANDNQVVPVVKFVDGELTVAN